MKKFNLIGGILLAVILLWSAFSIGEIAVKSSTPNSHYNSVNLFTILFPPVQEEVENEEVCGGGYLAAAEVVDIFATTEPQAFQYTFMTLDGKEWIYYSNYPYKYDSYYIISFDGMGTDTIDDDVIIQIYQECEQKEGL